MWNNSLACALFSGESPSIRLCLIEELGKCLWFWVPLTIRTTHTLRQSHVPPNPSSAQRLLPADVESGLGSLRTSLVPSFSNLMVLTSLSIIIANTNWRISTYPGCAEWALYIHYFIRNWLQNEVGAIIILWIKWQRFWESLTTSGKLRCFQLNVGLVVLWFGYKL